MSRCPQPDPAYAAACSAQTLCARRGFLRALLPELAALPDAGWCAALEPLPDAARLRKARAHPQLMEALDEVLSRVTPVWRGKDARASRASRLAAEAELAGARGQPGAAGAERALARASEAVLRAPAPEDEDEDTTLALALWTRSAALLARERARRAAQEQGGGRAAPRGEGGARAALADLGLALRAHLPARMRAHYYWRAGQCYQECGEGTRAKVSLELALRLLRDDAERARLQRELEQLAPAPPAPLPAPAARAPEITLAGGASLSAPSLSKLIEIVEEEGKGRFAAARAPVRPGDVLLVEEPYAACLLPDRLGTHCLHCFTRLSACVAEAPLWCGRCAGVAFCSQRCRQRGLRYHQHECTFLDLFIGSGMSILSHIALRMVTQLGLAGALDAHARHVAATATAPVPTPTPLAHTDIEGNRRAKMKSRKERLNRNKKGIKAGVDRDDEKNKEKDKEQKKDEDEDNLELQTAQIYQLCTHSEQRTGEDYLQRLVVAAFLTECLYKRGFFEGCAGDLEEARWAITELIIRNLQLLQFNAHEVFETLRDGGEGGRGGHLFRGARAHHVAVAIYPTGALFNHDCFPATARFFVGRSLVLAATRPLAAGAPAAECYGPAAALRPPPARRRALAGRYWFTCGCDACARPALWPALAECGAQPPPLRCVKEECPGVLAGDAAGGRCDACGAGVAAAELARRRDVIDDCHALFQEGARLMDEEKVSEAVAVLCGALDRFHAVAAAPRRAAYLAHEALRAALAAAGNTHVVTTSTDDGVEEDDDMPAPN